MEMRGVRQILRTVLRIPGLIALGIVVVLVVGIALGAIVMLLWNWLMPEIFGLPTISYLQGIGLVVLSHLLFKAHTSHSSGK